MECEHIRKLLGPLYDGELERADEATVKAHLSSCPECSIELAGINELTELVRMGDDSEPPEYLWDQIHKSLARPPQSRFRRILVVRSPSRVAAVAAFFVAGFVAGWGAHFAFHSTEAGETVPALAATNDTFIDQLFGSQAGETVSFHDVSRRVDFRVLTTSQLPEGYCLCGCCVCREGCCDMVKCKFIRGTDELLLVQGASEYPVKYGELTTVQAQVNGKPARILQCSNGLLAATWQTKGTALSLIGPHDLSELVRLVTFVDQHL
jgi:hypothetical protein